MASLHAYPAELAAFAQDQWAALEKKRDPAKRHRGQLPDLESLTALLSVAYQASLYRDEDRAVRFRVYLGQPEQLNDALGPPEGLQVLRFTAPRSFDEQEVRRLSQAVKYHRALIGVHAVGDGDFEIWGMLQSGPRWLLSARGGRELPSPIPEDALVVRVQGPGHLAIVLGDVMLAEMRGGRLTTNAVNVLESKWLRARFVESRAELIRQHTALVPDAAKFPLDPDLPRAISQQLVKRLIAAVQEAHHGASVVFLPSERAASIIDGERIIHLKYAFAEGEPRRRYRTLILQVMRELVLAASHLEPPPERIGWSLYQGSARPVIAALDEAVLEMSQLIAGLSDVDGAVVLTERFEVLGFGGELLNLPEVESIRRARDLEAAAYDIVSLDNVGTRHRSAYRLCARERSAMAVVVSQDGGVQFVAWHEGALTYWEHRTGPTLT